MGLIDSLPTTSGVIKLGSVQLWCYFPLAGCGNYLVGEVKAKVVN
jgi:hypothetical protein